MGNVVVKLENVRKKIGGTEIIRGLSFEVREGEVYGFLGPNGSGKTTTIRMMTGLISMTEGDITICGHSIRSEREKALEQIGAIVENPELYDYMTGMQNLKHFANMAITPIRGCCKTKINIQCYESEKLAEHAIDSDFDHTNVAVPTLYL